MSPDELLEHPLHKAINESIATLTEHVKSKEELVRVLGELHTVLAHHVGLAEFQILFYGGTKIENMPKLARNGEIANTRNESIFQGYAHGKYHIDHAE